MWVALAIVGAFQKYLENVLVAQTRSERLPPLAASSRPQSKTFNSGESLVALTRCKTSVQELVVALTGFPACETERMACTHCATAFTAFQTRHSALHPIA